MRFGKTPERERANGRSGRRCTPFRIRTNLRVLNAVVETTGPTPSTWSFVLVFYAAGGARLGPGARGAPPSASTFSRASRLSAKSGVTMQVFLNSEAGADERGSARTKRRCDTCRRCPDEISVVPNPSRSTCRITCRTNTPRATSRACVPLGMHSAQTPQRTATSESRKAAECRRAMGVPAACCTFRRDAHHIAHVSGGKAREHIHTTRRHNTSTQYKERSRVFSPREIFAQNRRLVQSERLAPAACCDVPVLILRPG